MALKGLAERVVVVHVIGVKIAKGLNSDQLDVLRQEGKARLAGYRRQLEQAGIHAETILAEGRTAAQIIRLARQTQASMIALGRTGKDWLSEYFLGGVSHRVAENSELPVLLVP
jgi:nucleotide-binding universal stress UspA family protein